MRKVPVRSVVLVFLGVAVLFLSLGLLVVFLAEDGKPASVQANSLPPIAVQPTALPSATPAPTGTSLPTATILSVPTPTSVVVAPTATPEPIPPPQPTAPPKEKDAVELGLVATPPDLGRTNGRWIDLNLGDGYTRLMQGRSILKEIPSAWGYGTPGAADDYFSTPPDRYFVYEKYDYLHYDETYSTGYFRGWVGFDPERANGFHSFILDAQEKVIDLRLGPVSHGCVRVEDWRAVYDFAQVGMPIMIHGSAIKDFKEKISFGKRD